MTGLLTILERNEDARKIFGAKEIEIIEKQLLGVNLSQSEKNRLSRDIRRKLDFVKDVSRFSDEFELKKGEGFKRMLHETVEAIKKDPVFKKTRRIILFGSAARNDVSLKSDVDVAIDMGKVSAKDATEIRRRILSAVPDRMDVQILSALPRKIRAEISKQGRILLVK